MYEGCRCPHCLSEVATPDDPRRNLHFVCGSERVGDKVYRAPGCYEIREGKLEALVTEIGDLPDPSTDSDAYASFFSVKELIWLSKLMRDV